MATITLTTPGGEDAIISTDVGAILGLQGGATLAQIKAMIIADFRLKLKEYRDARDSAIARAATTPPTMT